MLRARSESSGRSTENWPTDLAMQKSLVTLTKKNKPVGTNVWMNERNENRGRKIIHCDFLKKIILTNYLEKAKF